MARRAYRELGDLREELRANTGFGAMSSGATPNDLLLAGILRRAQFLLYMTHDWAHLRKYETINLAASGTTINYPATANKDRIKALSSSRGGVWSPPLPMGIAPQLYTTQANESWPQRWEPYEESIEIWPQADIIYPIRVFYVRNLYDFDEDQDTATIDDTMIMLLATAMAKAHYRQPDATVVRGDADTLLTTLKAKSWGKAVFNPKDFENEDAFVKPVTV